MVISTVAALGSAFLFAITTNLQRAAASSVPSAGSGPVHLVRRLLADRRWLAGGLIGGAALGLHAVALVHGSVVVVQAVMALGLVIALAMEAVRARRRLRPHELAGAALVVVGVALIVLVSHGADRAAQSSAWAVVLCAVVVAGALAAVLASRHRVDPRYGARLLAAAGGACFAVDAVFLQRVAALLDGGLADLSSGVQALGAAGDLAGFFGASMVGTVAIHRAYQVAELRVVQPALAAAEPVTAFVVGMAVLHQGVRDGAFGYVVLVGGLLTLICGIFVGLLPEPAAPLGAFAAEPVAAEPVAAAVRRGAGSAADDEDGDGGSVAGGRRSPAQGGRLRATRSAGARKGSLRRTWLPRRRRALAVGR